MDTYSVCNPTLWVVVFSEAQRWRTARLELPSVERTPIPFTDVLDLPELDQAGLKVTTSQLSVRAIDLEGNPLRWLTNAPRLRRLSLAWPFFPSVVHVVWGRLTHLKLELRESLRECVTVLPQCASLEYLGVSVYEVQWGEAIPVAEVPTLQTLVLKNDAVVLCRYIHVPQLTRLAFCPNQFLPLDRCHALVVLGRRQSLRSLQYLYLRHSLFEWSRIDPMLEQLSGLTHLHITHSPARLFRGTPPRLCCIGKLHTLRTLSIYATEAEWFHRHQLPDLPELLEGEIEKLSKLETLNLWRRPEPGVEPELDEWIDVQSERGIKVERNGGCPPFPDEMDGW
ncbi:hypothetical protein EV121DRAFT_294791 [Schizophyllum commune]